MSDRGSERSLQAFMTAAIPFVAVFSLLVFWIPSIMSRLDPLTGDEPFYVMTALSLIDDHDFDETNNYAKRDFDTFYPALGPTQNGWQGYPDPLPPHSTDARLSGLYSKHGLGLSLVVAIPWALGGRTLTLIVLALIAAAVAANMALLGLQVGAGAGVAVFVAILLAVTSPLLSFSLLIFPEMTAALCIVYATRRLLADENRWWQWLPIGFSAAALPWLHLRLTPVSLSLAVVAVLRFRSINRRWDWIMAILAPLLSGLSLAVWMHHRYGTLRPPDTDHAGFSDLFGTLNGLAGTFFDQQWGALIHNTVLVLAIGAIVPFARRKRSDAVAMAIVIVPYLLVFGAYQVWWGEWNPPARYLTDIVPLLAAPLAWWLSRVRPLFAAIAIAIAAIPALSVAAAFMADPQFMYNHPDGTSRLFEEMAKRTSIDLTQMVPSYVTFSLSPGSDRLLFSLGGIAFIVALALWAERAVWANARVRK